MGDVAAVKKALIAVSDRLRENPPRDRDVPTARPVGHLSQGSGIPSTWGYIFSKESLSITKN